MATLLGKIVADFRTTLATEIAVGGTSATLQSATDSDGNALPAGTYYLTLDKEGSRKEHIVCSLSGTSITSISSVSRQGVVTSGTARKHRIGASVEITDFAHISRMNDLLAGTTDLNASTPLKYDGTATISNSNHLATKAYVDGVAIAGAPDASTTVKGIVEIATGAELAAGTGTGGTGAVLVPAGSSFTNTSAGAGDANKVAVLDASGQLATGFIKDASTTVAGKVELATGAETAAGTATGGAGPLVPANSSFTATSSGSADANKVPVLTTGGVIASGFMYPTGTSGEAFSAGAGLYIKNSDGKLYRTLGTGDESTFSFVGIAIDAAAGADATVRYAAPGQSAALTSSTVGSPYFITDSAGTLGTTPGTRFARVAIGLPGNRVQVVPPKFKVSGTQSVTAATTYVQTTGFYPGTISIRAASSSTGIGGGSIGDDSNTCIAFRMLGANNDAQARSSEAWYVYDVNATTLENAGTVTSKTATGFTLNCTTRASDAVVQWTAESL